MDENLKMIRKIKSENGRGKIPHLDIQSTITCLYGRQRTQAAENFFHEENERWWPITLYCLNSKLPDSRLAVF